MVQQLTAFSVAAVMMHLVASTSTQSRPRRRSRGNCLLKQLSSSAPRGGIASYVRSTSYPDSADDKGLASL